MLAMLGRLCAWGFVTVSLAVGLALFVPGTGRVEAQLITEVTSLRAVPLGYQQITSLSAATALTVPTGATVAVFVAETQAIRYRDDGTDPSATVGMPVAVAITVRYGGNLSAIKFIEQTSGAKLNVSYYR